MSAKRHAEDHCQHVTAAGRRCRMLRAKGHASLCPHHSGQDQRRRSADALAEMTASIEDFTTAAAVNRFLGTLLKMMARGLIPRRDAAVLGYLCQLLLNTLPALRRELLGEDESSGDDPTMDPAELCAQITSAVKGRPVLAASHRQ